MVKKDITFIYSDSVEELVYKQISEEAIRRGYTVHFTDNKFQKCEIGWYCQHVNFPQYSKFSIIMLHDITQQYKNWPDIWIREPWNKYDIGFLPSLVWKQNWEESSKYSYANTRKGVFLAGWPKADRINAYLDPKKREQMALDIGLDLSKSTILYAPAWENDNKQDEFVKAMQELGNVNMLIKQAPWSGEYPDQLRNIAAMRSLHADIPNVFQLDPKTNILDAIMVSDILVSEESSTMSEAVMMGKPAVSVTDWLIPDVVPSRYPADDYEFAVKTTKDKLSSCISEILDDYCKYENEAIEYARNHFSNIGKCIPIMFDIIDEVLSKGYSEKALQPAKRRMVPFKRWIFYIYEKTRREFCYNYKEKSQLVRIVWNVASKIKHSIKKNT